MSVNKIYHVINEVLNNYLEEGIKPEHLLNYLNTNENNYKYMYNRIYRRLTLKDISFESKQLEDCLKDSIRDKIAILNDVR